MHIEYHEYVNEADDDNVPKPAQSLGTLVLRQKWKKVGMEKIKETRWDEYDNNKYSDK